MINGLIRFFWTSGRKCNFDGCDREDLQPAIVNGRNLANSGRLSKACTLFFSLRWQQTFWPSKFDQESNPRVKDQPKAKIDVWFGKTFKKAV